jgi:hypothetical protein
MTTASEFKEVTTLKHSNGEEFGKVYATKDGMDAVAEELDCILQSPDDHYEAFYLVPENGGYEVRYMGNTSLVAFLTAEDVLVVLSKLAPDMSNFSTVIEPFANVR